MSRMVMRVVALGLAVVALMTGASLALGHAALVTSSPAAGATITTPFALDATFDEDLKTDGSCSITVRDSAGATVATGGVRTDPLHMSVDLPALPPGAYVAHWIAITADDNGKTQGDISFTVSAGSPGASVSTLPGPTSSPTVDAGSGASGTDLLVPVIVVIAAAFVLGWFLLRRRSA